MKIFYVLLFCKQKMQWQEWLCYMSFKSFCAHVTWKKCWTYDVFLHLISWDTLFCLKYMKGLWCHQFVGFKWTKGLENKVVMFVWHEWSFLPKRHYVGITNNLEISIIWYREIPVVMCKYYTTLYLTLG